jgi:TetR/AcrR family transcriptional repressor of nem operon
MARPTRDLIISNGIDLIRRKGLSASGLAQILQAANVPKGSFYHYFPGGKDQLVLAVVERYTQSATVARHQTLRDTSLQPIARLRAHFQSMRDAFADQQWRHGCLLGNLAAEAADENPPLRAALRAAFDAWISDVADTLLQAERDEGVALPHAPIPLAQMLVAGWEGAILLMKSHQGSTPLNAFIDLWFGPTETSAGLLSHK